MARLRPAKTRALECTLDAVASHFGLRHDGIEMGDDGFHVPVALDIHDFLQGDSVTYGANLVCVCGCVSRARARSRVVVRVPVRVRRRRRERLRNA